MKLGMCCGHDLQVGAGKLIAVLIFRFFGAMFEGRDQDLTSAELACRTFRCR